MDKVMLYHFFRIIWTGLLASFTWLGHQRRWLVAIAFILFAAGAAARTAAETPPPPTETMAVLSASPSASSVTTPITDLTATAISKVSATERETNGLIIGGVVLVIIIIGGTLGTLRQKPMH